MKRVAKKAAACALSVALLLSAMPLAASAAQDNTRSGFVSAKGTQFMCDGSPYYYGGTNCYYLTFKSKQAVDNVFNNAADMGLNVMRVWGNIDAGVDTGTKNDKGYEVFQNNNDGDGQKDGVYFQSFSKAQNRPVINEGTDGLQHLDYVVSQAEKKNMKLIVTFTNQWDAFGGMVQYCKWLSAAGKGSADHDDFYTNETIKGWYKDYVKGLLNHTNVYTGRKLKDEAGVFAWELANEPRCEHADQNCKKDIVYNWAKEMSAYVKSVDPDHMVSLGDEGMYNLPYTDKSVSNNYVWHGGAGMDFEKLMSIPNIDFATPHLYVDSWNMKDSGEDITWISKHAQTMKKLGKPIILEEFGLTDKSLRDKKYSQWLDLMTGKSDASTEYQGFNYWMIASYMENGSLYPDYDSYTVYGPADVQSTASTRKLIVEAAKTMSQKNICNTVAASTDSFNRSAAANITAAVNMKLGSVSGLACDGRTLSAGSDYSFNGSTLTISKTFLSSLQLASHTFTVLTTGGNKPSFTLKVFDSNVKDPELSVYRANVDRNPKHCQNLTVTMQKNGSVLRGIRSGSSTLTENRDYTVSGSTVTFQKSYLQTLPAGTAVLTFDFYEGIDRDLTLTVSDTTGNDTFDTFDSYKSTQDLQAAYSRNTNGNTVALTLATRSGSPAMSYTYKIDNPSYCGVSKTLSVHDYSAFKGVSLWVEGDGSGNIMTLQFRDSSSRYWETAIKLNFTGGKTISIPFSQFTAPSWQSAGGSMNPAALEQMSVYLGGNTGVTSGTITLDNILAYSDGQQPTQDTDAVLNISSAAFDRSAPAAVSVPITYNGNRLVSIQNSGSALASGSDYTLNNSGVLLNASYLQNLSAGSYNLLFTFSNGKTAALPLTVTEQKTPVTTATVIDSFDHLNSGDYARNNNGNQISVTGDNGRAKVSYTVGNPSYAGFTRQLSGMDWSKGKAISFQLSNDTAGRTVVFQFRDKNGAYFEARTTVAAGSSMVTLPLSSFQAPSWAQGHSMDLSAVYEYSVYIESGSAAAGSGTLYLDNLVLEAAGSQPSPIKYQPKDLKVVSNTAGLAVVTWSAVDSASSYTVMLNGSAVGTTTSSAFALTGLHTGARCTISVTPVLTVSGQAESASLTFSAQ